MKAIIEYNLKNNPFRISPSGNANELIWVGMPGLQEKINDRIDSSVKTSPSRLVLNWGKYGSGKTHAANFYTKTDYIKNELQHETKNIKVSLPRSSKNPVQTFLRALVGQLNFDNIVNDFDRFFDFYQERSITIIEENTNDSIIAQFLKLFIEKKVTEATPLFPTVNRPADKTAMRDFLYGDVTKNTLRQLNLPLGLEDDEQIVNLISGIFNIITFEKQVYKSVFLWIDEFEDIDTLPKPNQDRFTTFLRQLIDKCPNNLTIFLNFTVKGVADFEDLSIILGEALNTRVSQSLVFDEPSLEQAKDYIKKLLNHSNFRDKVNPENLFYPFTEESATEVLINLKRLSLRKINETFSLILELALYHQDSPDLINWDFIKIIGAEIPSLQM